MFTVNYIPMNVYNGMGFLRCLIEYTCLDGTLKAKVTDSTTIDKIKLDVYNCQNSISWFLQITPKSNYWVVFREGAKEIDFVQAALESLLHKAIDKGDTERVYKALDVCDLARGILSMYSYDYCPEALPYILNVEENKGTVLQEAKARQRGRPFGKSLYDEINGNEQQKKKVLKCLHTVIEQGSKGKKTALAVLLCVQCGTMNKPTFAAVCEEFGNIGSQSGFNKYMAAGLQSYKQEEVAGMETLLSEILGKDRNL